MPVTPITPAQTDALAKRDEPVADVAILRQAAAAGRLRIRCKDREGGADPDAGMVWPIEVELSCINGLSCWFTIGNLYTPDAAARGYTDGALSDELAQDFAAHIIRSLSPVPTVPDALAKLAEIPAVGSEERERWLDAAGSQMADAKPGSDWVLSDDAILTLMSEARKQGQADVHGESPTGPGYPSETTPSGRGAARGYPSREAARIVEDACKPWEYHAGDPPADDNPLLAVYDAGLGYAFDLLAKSLGLETFTPSEGSESWEGDVNGTLWNILREARVADPETNEIARAPAFAAANPSGGKDAVPADEIIAGLALVLEDIRDFPEQKNPADDGKHMRRLAQIGLDGLAAAHRLNAEALGTEARSAEMRSSSVGCRQAARAFGGRP